MDAFINKNPMRGLAFIIAGFFVTPELPRMDNNIWLVTDYNLILNY